MFDLITRFQFIGPAKLPRGVSVIREHLRETDNVPLLVPLFTDANPAAMKEMVRKIPWKILILLGVHHILAHDM